MRNNSNSQIAHFTKADSVLNTPGQFFFQITEENDIKYGKNNTLNKKKVDEIKSNIQLIFRKIADNLKHELDKDYSYFKSIIHKLEKFANSPFRFPGLQVINLTKDHIEVFSQSPERILICEKSDGVRYLLIHFVNDIILFLGRNMEFYFVELNFKLPRCKFEFMNRYEWEIENFLDGELILDRADEEILKKYQDENSYPKNLVYINDKLHEVKFLVFDGVIVRGVNIGNLKFRHRLKKVNEYFLVKDIERKFINRYRNNIEKSILENLPMKISNDLSTSVSTHINPNTKFKIDLFMKDYYTFDKMEFLYNKLIAGKFLPHDNDGVIINLDDYPYYTGQSLEIYKWKPANLNSIDFEITTVNPVTDKKTLYVLNISESRDKLMPIACLFFADEEEFERFHREYQEIAISGKGAIAECFYNFQFNNEDTTNYHLLCDREVIRRSDSSYAGLQNLQNYNFKFLQQELATNKKLNVKKYEFGSWQFLRFRRDKLTPNSSYTYFSIMKAIMENVQMSDIMNKIEENKKKGIRVKLDANQSLATHLKNCLRVENDPNLFEFDEPPMMKNTNEKETPLINTTNTTTNNVTTNLPGEDMLKKKRGIERASESVTNVKQTFTKTTQKFKKEDEEESNIIAITKGMNGNQNGKIKSYKPEIQANSDTPIHVDNPEFVVKKSSQSTKKEKEKEKREKILKQANQSLSFAFSAVSKSGEHKVNLSNPIEEFRSYPVNNPPEGEGIIPLNKKRPNSLLNDEVDSLEESSSD